MDDAGWLVGRNGDNLKEPSVPIRADDQQPLLAVVVVLGECVCRDSGSGRQAAPWSLGLFEPLPRANAGNETDWMDRWDTRTPRS